MKIGHQKLFESQISYKTFFKWKYNFITNKVVFPLEMKRDYKFLHSESDKFFVYKITCNITNKCYIGFTKNVKTRWEGHCYAALKRNAELKFSKAIREFGIENWTIETLESFDTALFAKAGEIYWIEFYDSFNDGYNSTKGGEGLLGFIFSQNTLQKMSDAQIGEKNHNFGKKNSLESNRKNSESHKKIIHTELHNKHVSEALKGKPVYHNRHKVSQFDLNGKYITTFDSIKDAAQNTNTSGNSIIGCTKICRRYSNANGFLWRTTSEDDYLGIIPPVWEKLKSKHCKKVYQFIFTHENILINEFDSVTEATNKTGISKIGNLCKNKKIKNGFMFQYEGDIDPKVLEAYDVYIKNNSKV